MADHGLWTRLVTGYNDDICVEILSWLPVKSLLRFRGVCKSWRALISSSCFVRKHLSHAVSGNNADSFRLLLLTRAVDHENNEDCVTHEASVNYEALKDLKTDVFCINPEVSQKEFHDLLTVGSCNGLICLRIPDHDVFVLWNPSIRYSKVLRKPPSNLGLGFYGFGYDSTVDDYKVIRGCSESKVIQIFTVKTNAWRTVRFFEDVNLLQMQGCLFNGALYWLEIQYDAMTNQPVRSRIVSFDFAKEKFQESVTLPHPANKKYVFAGMGTIRDGLFVYPQVERTDTVRIWVMKEYGRGSKQYSWTKLMKIPSQNLVPEPCYNSFPLKLVCVLENDQVLLDLDTCRLQLYNPKENTITDIVDPEEEEEEYSWHFDAVLYTETLVSPEM